MDLTIKELTIIRDCLINEIGTLKIIIKNQSGKDKKELYKELELVITLLNKINELIEIGEYRNVRLHWAKRTKRKVLFI